MYFFISEAIGGIIMGRYYEKVNSYTRKVRSKDNECNSSDDSEDNNCFEVNTDNIKVGW